MTADHRSRIRAWWREQLAAGTPIDLDAAAEEATHALIADPAFLAAIAESLIKPLVRDIGEKVATKRPNAREPRPVQWSVLLTSIAKVERIQAGEVWLSLPQPENVRQIKAVS